MLEKLFIFIFLSCSIISFAQNQPNPYEQNNLAVQYPDIVIELNRTLEQKKKKDMPLRDPVNEVFLEKK